MRGKGLKQTELCHSMVHRDSFGELGIGNATQVSAKLEIRIVAEEGDG